MTIIDRVMRASFKCWREHQDAIGRNLDKGRNIEDMSDSEREFAKLHAQTVIIEVCRAIIEEVRLT